MLHNINPIGRKIAGDADDNIVYFARHSIALDDRFPKVDDILDRLSADTRTARLCPKKRAKIR